MDKIYSMSGSLSLDYDDIDTEHERLIDILNEALRISRSEQGHVAGALDKTLVVLMEAMLAHFAHEERGMASLGYSDLHQHEAHHARCIERLRFLCGSVAGTFTNKSVLDQVFDMIIDDIIRADSGFKSFLYARGLLR
jgi:hemerythrin-like metal-binding protein